MLDNTSANGYISDIIRRGDMEGKAGTTLLLHNVPGTLCDRVLLVGLGKEKDFREKEFGNAVRTAVKTLNETGAFDASIFLTELAGQEATVSPGAVRQTAIAALDATYKFDQFKSKKDEVRRPLRKLTLGVERRNELGAGRRGANASGDRHCRRHGAGQDARQPATRISATQAISPSRRRTMAEAEFGLGCESSRTRLTWNKLGMHSLLAVARGSHQPPKLIVLSYQGAKAE